MILVRESIVHGGRDAWIEARQYYGVGVMRWSETSRATLGTHQEVLRMHATFDLKLS